MPNFTKIARRAQERLWNFVRETSGAAAVLGAILFPVVVGGIGLGAETGYWYMTQRKIQHAADMSAHAAGTRLRSGDALADIELAALQVAKEAGFSPISLCTEGTGETCASVTPLDPLRVEVVLKQTRPRLFSAIFDDTPVTLNGRAVARVTKSGGVACVLALSGTASGAVTVSGSTSVNLEGCDVASNSNASDSFLLSGTASAMTTGCVYAVGESSVSTGLKLTDCEAVKENAPIVRDPYASVPEPERVGTCLNKSQGKPNATTTLTPTEHHSSGVNAMWFCNGLDVKGNVTFGPGLYIIENGDFTVNSGSIDSSSIAALGGGGVTFYLAGGARLRLGGNAALNLAAPDSGPFSGLLFFGSRSDNGITHQLQGSAGSSTDGAIYAPTAHMSFTGNSKSDGCIQVIGLTVTFTGNSSFNSSCETAGTRDILTNESVAIVE